MGFRCGVSCHFQQYFSYIVAVSFIGGGNRIMPGENDQPATSDRQTLSYNVVSSTPRLSEIRTHNSYEYEGKKLIHNKKTDKGQA